MDILKTIAEGGEIDITCAIREIARRLVALQDSEAMVDLTPKTAVKARRAPKESGDGDN